VLTPPPIDGVFAIENHPLRLSQQTMSLRLVTLLIKGNSGRELRRLRGTYLTHLVLVDEAGARQLIRSKLREGLLPRTRAVEMVVVRAAGQPCDGCGEPIAANAEMVWSVASRNWPALHFHAACFEIWDRERAGLDQA